MPPIASRSPLTPQCVACCRRLSFLGGKPSATPALLPQIQVRGKKKNAKPRTQLNVRLVKDIPGYGRKGSIIPVPIGVMRNYYFPNRLADYIPEAEVREYRRKHTVFERDYEFGLQKQIEARKAGAEIKDVEMAAVKQPARDPHMPDHVRVELNLMESEEAFEALSEALPPFVNFYRTPIASPEMASNTQPAVTQPPAVNANIYGSVSTADIATSLKALLATSDLAGKIVLSDHDIRFVRNASQELQGDQQEEANRVKQLGEYDIEIKIKGYPQPIQRRVRVVPEEAGTDASEREARDAATEALAAENPVAGGEPNAELDSLEAQVKELEISIEMARRSARNPADMPTIGGAETFGKQKGSESTAGASNEGTGESRDAQQRM